MALAVTAVTIDFRFYTFKAPKDNQYHTINSTYVIE